MKHNNGETIVQTLRTLRKDMHHLKADIDLLKAVIVDDTFLTEEERMHIGKTIRDFRKEQKRFLQGKNL